MSKSAIPPTPSRKDYTENELYRIQAERNAEPIFQTKNPFSLFKAWMADARHLEMNDSNAMTLATVDSNGIPDVRMVLLKNFDEKGFVFYTNNESAKGEQLMHNKSAALCFHWKSLRRQVRIRGSAIAVTDAEADAYFKSRAKGSQIGAIASDQSRLLENREILETRIRDLEALYKTENSIKRPAHWGGWRVIPETIEFWRDRPFRLHDRLLFSRDGDNWRKQRLFP